MRRGIVLALAITAAGAALGAPAAAAARGASIQTMVVGRARTLSAAHSVNLSAKPATVRIGHRRCAVPARTALAALLASALKLSVTDAAGCDPASMFVTSIGGERNRGQAGWEYKIGHADPSFSAADPAGRLRPGQQLLWYWCARATDCQRTLSVTGAATGGTVQVRVFGYDENGHKQSIAGATVRYGAASELTDASGRASFALVHGVQRLSASKTGLVPSFPIKVS
jgi:hypothetical protein